MQITAIISIDSLPSGFAGDKQPTFNVKIGM